MSTAPTTPTVPDMIRRATGVEFEKAMAIPDFHRWTTDRAEAVRLIAALDNDPDLRAVGATITVAVRMYRGRRTAWCVTVSDPRRTCLVHEPGDPACTHSDSCFDDG